MPNTYTKNPNDLLVNDGNGYWAGYFPDIKDGDLYRFYVVGFSVLAAFDTLVQVSFKLAAQRSGEFVFSRDWLESAALTPWTYVAVAGYIGAFVTWMTLLEHAPVGPAFAASHIDVVTVLIASVLLLGEHLVPAQIAGGICIVIGIILLSRREAATAAGG